MKSSERAQGKVNSKAVNKSAAVAGRKPEARAGRKPEARVPKMLEVPAKIHDAHMAAVEVRGLAYAPYSKFQVGAALLTSDGQTVLGCNVENASYGGTVCAERVAIWSSVASGVREFSDIVVVTDAPSPAFPCAFCLQVMAEFFEPETKIWIADLAHVHGVHEFKDLLPKPFGPRQLEDAREAAAQKNGQQVAKAAAPAPAVGEASAVKSTSKKASGSKSGPKSGPESKRKTTRKKA